MSTTVSTHNTTYKRLRKLLQPGAVILSCSSKLLVGLSVDYKVFALSLVSNETKLPFGYLTKRSTHRLSTGDEYVPITGPAEINKVYVTQGEVRILLNQDLLVGEREQVDDKRVGYTHLRKVNRIILQVDQIDESCELTLGAAAIQTCVKNRESVYGLVKWGYEPNSLEGFEDMLQNLIDNTGIIRVWLPETSARSNMFTSILHNSLETAAGSSLSKVHEIIEELKYATRDNLVLLHPYDTGVRKGVEGVKISDMEASPNSPYRFWYEIRTPRIFSGYVKTYWLREG